MPKPEKQAPPKQARASTSTRSPAARPSPTGPKPRAASGVKRKPAVGFEPSHDLIAARAYDLFERSGRPHGRDVEFWLEAERQVKHPHKA